MNLVVDLSTIKNPVSRINLPINFIYLSIKSTLLKAFEALRGRTESAPVASSPNPTAYLFFQKNKAILYKPSPYANKI